MTKFTPFEPPYSIGERFSRIGQIAQATTNVASHLIRQTDKKFAASVEITDRCNAGCHYCYVYPQSWDQRQRVQGYLQLTKEAHRQKEAQVLQTLDRLKAEGIVHVTLVGGEPALASDLILHAATLFPIVWVVSNGAVKLPALPRSVSVFVSMDGTPEYHNQSRDPMGFFKNHQYRDITGMSAAIARNINESERGAYVHLTLTRQAVDQFPGAVEWLTTHIEKLRGIVVSGTTAHSVDDPVAYTINDRQRLKEMINQAAERYGWALFPFNQPIVNNFMFDAENIIHSPSDCSVSRRVESLNFDGESVGKCVLRDTMACETCMCNITALARAIDRVDFQTLSGVIGATFG